MPNTHPYLSRLLAGFLVFPLVFAPVMSFAAPSASSPKAASSKASAGKTDNTYPRLVIGPGDLLSIFVYGENGVVGASGTPGGLNELPSDYQVDSDGVIVFPFIGRVKLKGLTPVEASEQIAKLLSKPRKVTVLIRDSSTFWVSVLGNVPKPGRYQIKGWPTLLSALSEAGGPLPDTDMGGAILIHQGEKARINLDKYLRDTGERTEAPYLYPGDVLLVQRSGWPTTGEWAIIASILASGAIIAVELSNIHK